MEYRFKEIREAKGKTQIEVAADNGVSQQYISRVEKGYTVPAIGFFVQLADYYEVPIEAFIRRDSTEDSKRNN